MSDEKVTRVSLSGLSGPKPARDPVCGMLVDRGQPPGGTAEHDGTTYYFCNPGCRERFVSDPESHLEEGPSLEKMGGGQKGSKDPVCGMTVDAARAAATVEHRGTSYVFCSLGCRDSFEADPDGVLSGSRQQMPGAGEGESVEWTCPMHPEVVESKPGPCPICGMALEPRVVTTATWPWRLP